MVLEKLRKSRKVSDEDYLVALDIGTEFVKALIAKLDGEVAEDTGLPPLPPRGKPAKRAKQKY